MPTTGEKTNEYEQEMTQLQIIENLMAPRGRVIRT